MNKKLLSVGLIALSAGCNRVDEPLFDPPPSRPLVFPQPSTPGLGGPVVTSQRGLAPLTGGTIRALADNVTVVVADPDRDRLVIYDRTARTHRTVELPAKSEPFRIVEHGDLVSVVLRASGQIATLDPVNGGQPRLREVCAMPRGVDLDRAADQLIVACAGGELVALGASEGAARVVARLEPDLRDVVVRGDVITVSRMRSAEAIQISRRDFAPLATVRPSDRRQGPFVTARPTVAWRTTAGPSGGTMMVHQLAQTTAVSPVPGGYGGNFDPCSGMPGGIVSNAISYVTAGSARTRSLHHPGLPLDLAISDDGERGAVVLESGGLTGSSVFTFATSTVIDAAEEELPGLGCNGQSQGGLDPAPIASTGPVTSVDFTPDGGLIAFQLEPAFLHIDGRAIALGGGSVRDTGRDAFHLVTPAGLACASCHAEGGDDGHVWDFAHMGVRRTQNLAGGLGGSAPFHWSGDMQTFEMLVNEVMVGRMQGPQLDRPQIDALQAWIDRIPSYSASEPADARAVARGKALFESAEVACATCHSGPRLGQSTPASFDVGTGGPFQVPSLKGIAFRGPFLHDGCATTLHQRFDPDCGGGDLHGRTSQLSASELDDLVAYLHSL